MLSIHLTKTSKSLKKQQFMCIYRNQNQYTLIQRNKNESKAEYGSPYLAKRSLPSEKLMGVEHWTVGENAGVRDKT